LDVKRLFSVTDSASIKETADNAAIFENAKDTYTLITNRFIPTVKKWIQVITKASGKCTDLSLLILFIQSIHQIFVVGSGLLLKRPRVVFW
jgi:hypothetical protein